MTGLISAARAFAVARHEGQLRKDSFSTPYSVHLAEVAALTEAFGGSEITVAAAWLHDTVEDCPPTTIEELAEHFGAPVASIVRELTDDKTLPKPERKRAQVRHAPDKSREAALVKLCDKASNCAAVGFTPPAHWDAARRIAYLDWAAEVMAALPKEHPAARAHLAGVLAAARARIAETEGQDTPG
jgi:(p)ppGpp synthase/HD superfamily hydrolase